MKTPLLRNALPLSGALVIGIATGWLLRGGGTPTPGKSAISGPQNTARPTGIPAAQPATPGDSATGVWDAAEAWSQLPAARRAVTLRHILALPEGSERVARFIALLHGLDREDIGVAARAIKEGDRLGLSYDEEWTALITHWGRLAGRDAVEHAFESFGLPQDDKDWFSKVALRGWAEADPQAAVGWVNNHPDHTDWAGCVQSIAIGVGKTDPALAAALMVKTLSGPDIPKKAGWVRDQIAGTLTGRVAATGGASGLTQWLASIPAEEDNGAMRRTAFLHTAARMDKVTDAEAQDFFTRFAADPLRPASAYSKFMTRLATNRSPQDALNWSASLPEPASGSSQVFAQWQSTAPQEAAAWLAALPESPFKASLSPGGSQN